MEESSEQKYDRIQRDIQSAILKNYPNPERAGCRGKVVVELFAKKPDRITAEDDVNPQSDWYHITHCSPCYAEFLDLRSAFRVQTVQRRFTRRSIIATSLAGCAGGVGWLVWQRDQPRTVDIDFEKYESTRSAGGATSLFPLSISTGRSHIRLRLPKDSAAGHYVVRISKDVDSAPVFSITTDAVTLDGAGTLAFDATIDAAPGDYALGVKGDQRGVWRYIPVSLERR